MAMSDDDDSVDYDAVPLSLASRPNNNNRYQDLEDDDEPPASPRGGARRPIPGLGLSRLGSSGSGEAGPFRSAALPPGALKLKLPARMPAADEGPATRRGGPEQSEERDRAPSPPRRADTGAAAAVASKQPQLKPPKLNLTNAASTTPAQSASSTPWGTAAVNNKSALGINLEASLSLSSAPSIVPAIGAGGVLVDLISPAFTCSARDEEDGEDGVPTSAASLSGSSIALIKRRCSTSLGVPLEDLTLFSMQPLDGPAPGSGLAPLRIGVMVNRSGRVFWGGGGGSWHGLWIKWRSSGGAACS